MWVLLVLVFSIVCAVRLRAKSPVPQATHPGAEGHAQALGMALFLPALVAIVAPALTAPFLDPEDYYHIVFVQKFLAMPMADRLRRCVDLARVRPDAITVAFQYVFHLPLYLASGLDPVGHRAVTATLHLASAWLVASLARRLGLDGWRAAASGGLFLVHPLFPSVVVTPTHLSSLLATCLFLLGLLYWLPLVLRPSSSPPRSALGLVGGWAIFLCLYATRLYAITFPFALGALALLNLPADSIEERRRRLRTMALATVPMAIFAAAHLALVFHRAFHDPGFAVVTPSRGVGDFSSVLTALEPALVVRRLLEYLPRDLLFPFFPRSGLAFGLGRAAARLAAVVIVLAGMTSGRQGLRATFSAASLLVLTALPFQAALKEAGALDPALLHLPAAAFALLACSWVFSIRPRVLRRTLPGLLGLVIAAAWGYDVAEGWKMRSEGQIQARLDSSFDSLTAGVAPGEWITLAGGEKDDLDRLRLLAMRFTANHRGYPNPFRILAPSWIIDAALPARPAAGEPGPTRPWTAACLPWLLALDPPSGSLVELRGASPGTGGLPRRTGLDNPGPPESGFALCGEAVPGNSRWVVSPEPEEDPTLWSLLSRF